MSIEATDVKDQELATLRRENEMLKNEKKQLKDELDESIAYSSDLKSKALIEQEADRKALLDEVIKISDGKIASDILDKATPSELLLVKMALDKTRTKTFASMIAAHDAEARKPKPVSLTVGQWDPQTKSWTGGV